MEFFISSRIIFILDVLGIILEIFRRLPHPVLQGQADDLFTLLKWLHAQVDQRTQGRPGLSEASRDRGYQALLVNMPDQISQRTIAAARTAVKTMIGDGPSMIEEDAGLDHDETFETYQQDLRRVSHDGTNELGELGGVNSRSNDSPVWARLGQSAPVRTRLGSSGRVWDRLGGPNGQHCLKFEAAFGLRTNRGFYVGALPRAAGVLPGSPGFSQDLPATAPPGPSQHSRFQPMFLAPSRNFFLMRSALTRLNAEHLTA